MDIAALATTTDNGQPRVQIDELNKTLGITLILMVAFPHSWRSTALSLGGGVCCLDSDGKIRASNTSANSEESRRNGFGVSPIAGGLYCLCVMGFTEVKHKLLGPRVDNTDYSQTGSNSVWLELNETGG